MKGKWHRLFRSSAQLSTITCKSLLGTRMYSSPQGRCNSCSSEMYIAALKVRILGKTKSRSSTDADCPYQQHSDIIDTKELLLRVQLLFRADSINHNELSLMLVPAVCIHQGYRELISSTFVISSFSFFQCHATYGKISFFQEAGEKSANYSKLFLSWKTWIETHVLVTGCAINTMCLEHARLALCVCRPTVSHMHSVLMFPRSSRLTMPMLQS